MDSSVDLLEICWQQPVCCRNAPQWPFMCSTMILDKEVVAMASPTMATFAMATAIAIAKARVLAMNIAMD